MDLFVMLNLLLFLGMCYLVYYDRFLYFRGKEFIGEFYFYAFVIVMAIIAARWLLRKTCPPTWLLVLVEIGILMHFAGGLTFINAHRLYDEIILGIRYDKYVHFFNAFVAACFIRQIWVNRSVTSRLMSELVLLVTVLGLGTIIEIMEYIVTLTIEANGVGNYDNNLQDLIANAAGTVLNIILFSLYQYLFHFVHREKGIRIHYDR